MSRIAAILLTVGVGSVAAQSKLEFEVASVRASGQPAQECFGKVGGPGTATPTRLHYGCYSVIAVIMDAYGMDAYRLLGLEKAQGINVELTATMKPGTTKLEMQQMLQNMLSDRFHLKVRRGMREGVVYELSVEKGGPKLKESLDDSLPADSDSISTRPLKMGADGMPDFPTIAGRITGGFGTSYKARALGTSVPIGELTAYLEPRLKAPVIDATGLKGKYDFRLDFIDPNYDVAVLPDASNVETFPPIPSALRSQLGLHLEKRHGQVEYLVIESMDKTPTEN
jgi:uncharacterized protein (TIGR03435 family)